MKLPYPIVGTKNIFNPKFYKIINLSLNFNLFLLQMGLQAFLLRQCYYNVCIHHSSLYAILAIKLIIIIVYPIKSSSNETTFYFMTNSCIEM
jgi:hypothetical protein